jgi:cyclin B
MWFRLQAAVKPQTSLRARDPNATAAALRNRVPSSSRPAGASLSALLQTRAESAVGSRAVAAGLPPPSPLPDIDSADKHNPLAASEYANSIYNYFRRVEPKFRVAPDYMRSQVRGVCVCVLRANRACCVRARTRADGGD